MKNKGISKITLGGLLTALAVITMLLGSVLGVMTYVAPTLAGIILYPLKLEHGNKTAWSAFAASSILALLIVPDREMSFFFVFFFGFYPIIYASIMKLRSVVLRWIIKMLSFNASIVVVYTILLKVLVSQAVIDSLSEETPTSIVVMWVVGNITFVLYDIIMSKLEELYRLKLRPKFVKDKN